MARRRPVDLVVVGGGPAGVAAAVTGTRAGASVVLLDRPPRRSARVGEGAPPELEGMLDDVFGPDHHAFDPAAHLPSFGTTSRWGDATPRTVDHLFHPQGHGWLLDRHRFDERLRAHAREIGVEVRLAGGDPLQDGRLFIDATGRSASFARSHGAQRHVHDRLIGLVAWFGTADDDDRTITLEATALGWWYTAAVPGNRRVVAFLTDADLLPPGARTAAGFGALLDRTSLIAPTVRCASAEHADGPQLIAADTATLDPVGDRHWLATGDALASFDPISSQGILTAVHLGAMAGRTAVAVLDGEIDALDRYAAERDAVMREHLAVRTAHYLDEQRWPDAPFWARRHHSRSVAADLHARRDRQPVP